MTTAFDPIDFAGTRLANRIAMAPMTRTRAGAGRVPTDLTAEYYAQRASAGLIISESIQPSAVGQGSPNTPGLHSPEQTAAWRTVTDAVHAKGGKIFAQLMHAGRISSPEVVADHPGDLHPVSASAIAAAGQLYSPEGPKEFGTPRELSDADIRATIEDFAAAARNAVDAGFDGVELHGAYGYLVHQFLATGSNRRTDAWGGSVEGRIKFAVEVTKAVTAKIGPQRTGLRISPGTTFNDIAETDLEATYTALVEAIEPLGLAYLHVVESAPDHRELTLTLRKRFSGAFVLNPSTEGPTSHDALTLIEDGTADLVSFGALFLANPDLPARLRTQGPYNTPDQATFYGGDHIGYTDYPALTG
ncbi:alkene reductase [Streptomyces tubercidicus]|uniref:Alkene reductase n=1 Tax=Streptomyces tubercidicus TaxID=47759 RepID=A0A640UKD1_9ACTN|nr:alkene reductase [Streptomyces tubercidicus]WAU10661.1 alkene reductase [Streptomyces tubercidicus]GFE35792.1 alkene reductase [Streptomyces tubercidicus]